VPILLSSEAHQAIGQALSEQYTARFAKSRTSLLGRIAGLVTPPPAMLNTGARRGYRELGKLLKACPGQPRLLVVGCGERPGEGMRALGKDLLASAVNLDIGPFPIVNVVGTGDQLPFLPETFDAVAIQAVLEHVPYPRKVVDEIYRVLKPGGYVYAEIPFLQAFHAGPGDYQRYTVNGIKVLFEDYVPVLAGVCCGANLSGHQPALELCRGRAELWQRLPLQGLVATIRLDRVSVQVLGSHSGESAQRLHRGERRLLPRPEAGEEGAFVSPRGPVIYVNPTSVHGGAEEALLHMMGAAQERGYRPVLVTIGPGWLVDRAREQGILTEIVPVLPDTFQATDWRKQLRPWIPSALAIARVARRHRAIMVHSNAARTSYHGGLGARLAGVAALTHVHDMIGLPYETARQAALLTRLADWTLVPSNAVEHTLVGLAPRLAGRIQTLYNGWDQAQYSSVRPSDLHGLFNLPPGAFIVGNVAAMHPWKGQDLLITAFRILRDRLPRAHLLIVGGSQGGANQSVYEASLRQQVAEMGLSDAVTFTGWRVDVWSLMKSFDLFVHAPTGPDPLPTSVIHASALGVPILAASIGGIPEIVEDSVSGVLVPPCDAPALAAAIEALAGDPARRADLGAHARARFLSRFSHEQFVAGLASAYERCVAQRSRRE
jgi:glycosyltransferase involved in cell wall biosynthesis/SAM-dependent methyltransferase